MSTIYVEIVSSEEWIYSGSAERVVVPAVMGEMGILPKHAPLITRLKPGEIRVLSKGEQQSFFISGGILEVQPNLVTVLSDTAIRSKDLDASTAMRAKQRAIDALSGRLTKSELNHASAELAVAMAKFMALQRRKKI